MQIGWEQIRQDKIRLDQYWIDLDLNGKMDLDRLDWPYFVRSDTIWKGQIELNWNEIIFEYWKRLEKIRAHIYI